MLTHPKRPNSVILTPTPDVAYVRTGGIFSKQPKISTSNILMRLPIIHEVTPVNLKAFAVNIEKAQKNCLRSKDVFVDIRSVFTLQIDSQHITKAVEQFGLNTFTLHSDQLIHNVLEGVLREVTATMTLDELQEKRSEFTTQVDTAIREKFHKFGLVLLSTSILALEQTNIQYVSKDDIFGARTSAIVMKELQENRKKENDALRDNEVLVQTKDTETAIKKIDLGVKLSNETVEAEKKQIEYAKTREIAKTKALAEQEQASETALIQKDIGILVKTEEKLVQEESLAKAQEKVNEAQTNSETVRLKGIKEREKEIAIIDANQVAESNSIQIKMQADLDFYKIEQEAKAMERLADAKRKNYEVEADGIRLKNEAENRLSPEIIQYNQRMKLIENLPAIIAAMVKPMESIKDIKVISANGLFGGAVTSGTSGSDNVNDIFNSAFNYRLKNGTIDMLCKDVGIDLNSKNISEIIPTISMNEPKEQTDGSK